MPNWTLVDTDELRFERVVEAYSSFKIDLTTN